MSCSASSKGKAWQERRQARQRERKECLEIEGKARHQKERESKGGVKGRMVLTRSA